jgi:membrane protein insertase Oxa1/YidC/SpoIIIJ
MISIWNDFLYQPLFNLLIWIYSNWTNHNLGWAVVYLTIILRVVLLPFSLVSEKAKVKNDELQKEVNRLEKELAGDPVLRKQEIRRVLRQRKVRHWSTAIVLGVQILVLVLLYQVFLRGITGEKMMKILYTSVDFPGQINIMFYGFDLGMRHDLIWPGIVAIFLLVEIYLDYRHHKFALNKADLAYFLLFPAFSFLALWLLPMVKSLFILTTMVFSVIIAQFSKIIFRPKEAKAEHH